MSYGDIEFVDLSGGNWIRCRDYVGDWVLFIAKSKEERRNTFTGESQTVAVVDFATLNRNGDSIQNNVRLSDKHIVERLEPGKALVGKIERLEPKKKGYQGAIIITQADPDTYQIAINKAKKLMNGSSAPTQPPAPQPETDHDELEDLLG